ncbi:hypothetical protein [Streptomyces formicae]
MALAIWALIRPRERGAHYGSTQLEEYRSEREWNRRAREWEKTPPPPPLAVEITGPDVKAIEALATAADRIRNDSHRPYHSAPLPYFNGAELIKQLYRRIGAASTSDAAPDTVPLYESEIRRLEAMADTVTRHSRGAIGHAGQQLLNKLHVLEGRARAMATVNGIPVTRPALGRDATQ